MSIISAPHAITCCALRSRLVRARLSALVEYVYFGYWFSRLRA